MSIIGPKFKKKAGAIIGVLGSADPESIADQAQGGMISIDVNGEVIALEPEAVTFEKEIMSQGHLVDVLEVGNVMVVIEK
jgi:valyl-tRNA synthetase